MDHIHSKTDHDRTDHNSQTLSNRDGIVLALMHNENHRHSNNYWLHRYCRLPRNNHPEYNPDPVRTTCLLRNNMSCPDNLRVFLPNTHWHKHPH